VIKPTTIAVTVVAADDLSAVLEAWRLSRPQDQNPDMNAVLRMDTPVNEFCHFTFDITAPILIRELICSERDHIIWARSSRVDDLGVWPVWQAAHAINADVFDEAYARMLDQSAAGAHQDEFRQQLPLCYMTRFMYRVSWRKLAALMRSVRKLLTTLPVESLARTMLGEFHRNILMALWNGVTEVQYLHFLNSLHYYRPHELFPLIGGGFTKGRAGDMVAFSCAASIALRAQLVRHRSVVVTDTMRNYLTDDALLQGTLASSVLMDIVMEKSFAVHLVRQRSCWIAQSELWQPILDPLYDVLGLHKNWPALPCDVDGRCTYQRDNDLRLAGKDPAPPCPIACRLTQQPMRAKQAMQVHAYAGKRGVAAPYWQGALKLKGAVE